MGLSKSPACSALLPRRRTPFRRDMIPTPPWLRSWLTHASLDPIFLIIHQFNEFVPPDEGFDADTNDDVEPANLWGSGDLEIVRHQILMYRQQADVEGSEELP